MTDFVPMPILPVGPRGMDMPADQAPATRRAFTAAIPVSRSLRLDEIQGPGAPTPGTVYQYDYFLTHPTDGSIQRIWFAASEPTAQTVPLRLQIVDDEGTELSPERAFSVLPVVATLAAEQVGVLSGNALFLRVNAESQTAVLYVTVELLVAEVM